MPCFTPAVSMAVRAELTRGLTCGGCLLAGGAELGGGGGREERVVQGQLGRRRAYGIVYDPFDGY